MKYKKVIAILVFLFALMSINVTVFAQSMTVDTQGLTVNLTGDKITISGKLNEISKDVTIIVYRNSDNARSYIDQAKTNENGEFVFQFSLPNGTYKGVVSCDSQKYNTEDIVVNKQIDNGSDSGNDSKPESSTVKPKETKPVDNLVNISDIGGHWAEDKIKELITLGAISGYPDKTFKADNNITRAEFVTVLVKAFNLKGNSSQSFVDTKNHWANEYIMAATDNGVVLGYDDNSFRPNELITREQMSVMIVNTLKLEVKVYDISFKDKDQISEWAKKFVSTAVNEKLLVGYPDNTFRPKSNATRAEAVTFILTALNSIKN